LNWSGSCHKQRTNQKFSLSCPDSDIGPLALACITRYDAHYRAFCYSCEKRVHPRACTVINFHSRAPLTCEMIDLPPRLPPRTLEKKTARKIELHVPRGVIRFSKLLPLDAKESWKLIPDPCNYQFNIACNFSLFDHAPI